MNRNLPSSPPRAALALESVDYYLEGTILVFTEAYHRKRGYCCESGCRHCPYRGATADAAGAEPAAGSASPPA